MITRVPPPRLLAAHLLGSLQAVEVALFRFNQELQQAGIVSLSNTN